MDKSGTSLKRAARELSESIMVTGAPGRRDRRRRRGRRCASPRRTVCKRGPELILSDHRIVGRRCSIALL